MLITPFRSRGNPFSLLVALDDDYSASGSLYLDDGESLDTSGNQTLLCFQAANQTLTSRVESGGFDEANQAVLSNVVVLGLPSTPTDVSVNGTTVAFNWDAASKVLSVTAAITNLNQPFTLKWTLSVLS